MRLRVRDKLVLVSVLVMCVVSFGFTAWSLSLSRAWVEDDLRERAITFAREIAATIGDRRELENSALLEEQIRRIREVRGNVAHLDILTFSDGGSRVVASSDPSGRLPFTRRDGERVLEGKIVSRLVSGGDRYWEVLAPIRLADGVAGAVAARFSLYQADRMAARTRWWAFVATGLSVIVMALLMATAVGRLVDKPVRELMRTMDHVGEGRAQVRAPVTSKDEFGRLAEHFNGMVARIDEFSRELQVRVQAATAELDQRYKEVSRLNAALFEAQRRLGRAERLAVAGRVVAEVAHEIGTPLHSVAGHVELLRKGLPRTSVTTDVMHRFDIIETQLQRVTGIIAALLDEVGRVGGAHDRVTLEPLVHDTVELVQPAVAAAGLTLEVRAKAPGAALVGDRSQLQQVVLNLLTNAIDATPPGGRIEVTTRRAAGQDELVLEVRDTGAGIPESHRKTIFEPFFSTKPAGRGSGLGLFVSAQIVREHGGRIEVESAEGRGSTFRVILPRVEAS